MTTLKYWDATQNAYVVLSGTGPAGVGVPAGGAVGAALLKNSATDYDTVWSSAASTWGHAWNTGSQALLTGGNSWIALTYNNQEAGSSNINSTNGQYTCPTAGDYLISGEANFATNPSDGSLFIAVFRSGTLHQRGSGLHVGNPTTQTPSIHISTVVRCNAGDYLDIRVYCSIAGGISTAATATNDANYMVVRRLA